MSQVVPTINAENPAQFARMINEVKEFTKRVHIDICDGKFADRATIGLAQAYDFPNSTTDLHLMVEDPEAHLEIAASLKPQLIIYHFESTGDLNGIIKQTQDLGIKAGLALLPNTSVDIAAKLIEKIDHVLIFTGRLSHDGGEFQGDQLAKVAEIKAVNPVAEISVDGGVNSKNASKIAAAGVDILYTGAAIHTAAEPAAAFKDLQKCLA